MNGRRGWPHGTGRSPSSRRGSPPRRLPRQPRRPSSTACRRSLLPRSAGSSARRRPAPRPPRRRTGHLPDPPAKLGASPAQGPRSLRELSRARDRQRRVPSTSSAEHRRQRRARNRSHPQGPLRLQGDALTRRRSLSDPLGPERAPRAPYGQGQPLIYYAGHGELDRRTSAATGCPSMPSPTAARTGSRTALSPTSSTQ